MSRGVIMYGADKIKYTRLSSHHITYSQTTLNIPVRRCPNILAGTCFLMAQQRNWLHCAKTGYTLFVMSIICALLINLKCYNICSDRVTNNFG